MTPSQRRCSCFPRGALALRPLCRCVLLLLALLAISVAHADAGPQQAPPPLPGSVLTGELQQALVALPAGELLPVIVLLRDEPRLPKMAGQARVARQEAVVRSLQSQAEAAQAGLVGLLEGWQRAGRAGDHSVLWIVNGIAVSAEASVIYALATRPEVGRIMLDASLPTPTIDSLLGEDPPALVEPNIALVNAPLLWDLGYAGQGVVVAILDTGVDVSHPDLADRWRGGANSWYDPYGQRPDAPVDFNGHGTAAMGVIIGGNDGGSSIGLAPEAQWIAARIFDDRGKGTLSAVHQAFQWVLDPDGDPATPDAPHIVSNSWTIGSFCSLTFQPDIQALRAAGIVPVFAAGNYGPNPGTAVSPANNLGALAVGATDNDDLVWKMSSRGPSGCGQDATYYPHLVAPGVAIRTTDRQGTYQIATGTSLSAPHVAGALALLMSVWPAAPAISAAPEADVTLHEQALFHAAIDLGDAGPDDDYGAGRLDVHGAYEWLQGLPRHFLPAIRR